jgi:hypothetical protein
MACQQATGSLCIFLNIATATAYETRVWYIVYQTYSSYLPAMLQRKMARETTMSVQQSNIPAGWAGHVDARDWAKRAVAAARTVLESMSTGLEAARDYRTFATQLPPRQAAEAVFKKHFGK